MKKTVVTITGIRPDFIRMSAIFKKLDEKFNHILIHTGQHYDTLLSDIFFQELSIRKPNYILNAGKESHTHYEQLAYLAIEVPKLFKEHNIMPELILFLGDSNTSNISLPLKKEGYKIGHIEAGMRSGDKRMLEEINRTICDHCSDILFVYHEDYKRNLWNENIRDNVYVVGNTIKEVCMPFMKIAMNVKKREDMILLDIHRPENFKFKGRMMNIIKYANMCIERYGLEVQMLEFYGTMKYIKEFGLNIGKIKMVSLMSYKKYLDTIYHCKFIISDSGTGQEEPAMMKTHVIVPRDYTERPQSVKADCSYMLDVNTVSMNNWNGSFEWVNIENKFDTEWLGDGKTAEYVINHIDKFLEN